MGTLKTLSAFDFSLQPSLDRNHALALAQLDIIDSLAKVDREGRLRERIGYLCRASLLIIDA